MSSVASTETLASLSDFEDPFEFGARFPDKIFQAILKETIGLYIHNGIEDVTAMLPLLNVDSTVNRQLFIDCLWRELMELSLVSSGFHVMVFDILSVAFGVTDDQSIPLTEQVYSKFRSFVYFANALECCAFILPSKVWRSPVLEAYGYYLILKRCLDLDQPGYYSVVSGFTSVDALDHVLRLSASHIELLGPLRASSVLKGAILDVVHKVAVLRVVSSPLFSRN